MEWYVYRYNINSRKVERFNIFNHGSFSEDFEKLRQKGLERDGFAEELNRLLMYYFWSKYEYEVVVGELTDRQNKAEEKVDIYDQVRMNWQQFLDYVTGRASPVQIGDKLWYCSPYGNDPCAVVVRMITQKADRAWKIRVKAESPHTFDLSDEDIGRCLFKEKDAAIAQAVKNRARQFGYKM